MFSVDNDMTILITRGDTAVIPVTAVVDDESNYVFQPDDVLRFKVFEKKNCDNVILEVDFSVEEETEQVDLVLTEQHTTIGGTINKPVDYWYEVELNPLTNPQTIVGYDDDGPKIFRLYPEGKEREPVPPKPEDLETVDSNLDTKSTNPIQNQAVARAIVNIETTMDENEQITVETFKEIEKKITNEVNQRSGAEQRIDTELAVLRGRIRMLKDLPEGSTVLDAEVIDARVDFTGKVHNSAGENIRESFNNLFSVVGCGKNLFNPNDADIVNGLLFDGTGALTVTNANFMTSGYIKVQEGKQYYFSVTKSGTRYAIIRSCCFYDANKNIVSSITDTKMSIAIPTEQNIKYIRVSSYAESYGGSEWQFEADEQTAYEPYHLVYEFSKNIDINSSSQRTSFNLFNADDVYDDRVIDVSMPYMMYINDLYITTRPIYIKGFDSVVLQYLSDGTASLPRAIVFYNANGKIVAHYDSTNGSFPSFCVPHKMTQLGTNTCVPVPDNAEYVVVSVKKDIANTYMIYGVVGANVRPKPIPYVPYTEYCRIKQDIAPKTNYIKSYFNGKKIVTIGDSITQGYKLENNEQRWAEQVASLFNMTLINYGIGGSEIAQFKDGNNQYNPMCIRYVDMDDDADLVVVAGGTNDWNHNHTTLGDFGDKSIHTFYGALDVLCRGLLAKYVGKNIMFITPIKRWHGLADGAEYYNPNTMGYTLEQFVEAIKKVCGFYGIPVLDMFNECTINPIIPEIAEAYIPDGTHPNYEGHKIMARQIAGFISKLANDIDYN